MAVQAGGIDGRMSIITVPAGATVRIVGDVQQSGLVDVEFDTRLVAMFLRDVQERGEQVGSAAR